ncbi:hypothetical protein PND37_10170 [Lactiplantibacillus plantarum]|uniref:hypothetical protein n=1 Tax=Lactiplantibacillus plantarum TaxID=1590 RepID=UPI00077E0BC1|nr:hypothetical protein [Lactiplantibacillus plantarum]AXH04907.1 hypothetical protein CEB41_10700 [Lactiplantibacillus plantarum]KYK00705.1 hypothetical protein Lpl43_14055 [Lactiplantibacillus plantarum]MCT3206133.1 hypothetical protein [Lactiplantibacillus plantarum]MCT3220243.1 hypothetical protein [Lactiplantibacillus plantarum]MCT3235644.1 hypothetical protein [Lactiplantibacillus plantarum]
MITLLLVIYTLIAGWLSYYLLTHQSRPFLFFDPNKAPTIKHVARYGGGLMLLVTIACCFVTIFVQATMLIAIVLASGSLIMMAIALILVSFMQIS